MTIKLIKTQTEYDAALFEVEALMEADPKPGTEDGDKLKRLVSLIINHEEKHYPLDLPDPIEAIRYSME